MTEHADPTNETHSPAASHGGGSSSPSSYGGNAPHHDLQAGAPEPTALEEERDQLKEQMLRLAADYDNFRKRSQRELEDADRRGREQVLREVLPVIDNLERAVAAATSTSDAKSIADGVAMVLRLFNDDVAQRVGLERLKTVGERFDPTLHEAVQQLETSDMPAGSIVAEVIAGYRFRNRLLRPALVVVARPPASTSVEA